MESIVLLFSNNNQVEYIIEKYIIHNSCIKYKTIRNNANWKYIQTDIKINKLYLEILSIILMKLRDISRLAFLSFQNISSYISFNWINL